MHLCLNVIFVHRDGGRCAAIPTLYVQYFNSLALFEDADISADQRSFLEKSINLSQSMSQGSSELMESEEVTTERKKLQFALVNC